MKIRLMLTNNIIYTAQKKLCACGCGKILKRAKYIVGHNPETIAKREKTMMEKYGKTNASQIQQFKDKKEDTCFKNYGRKNPSQSEDIKLKKVNTCLKNNGTEYPIQCKEIRQQIDKTNIRIYGFKNAMQSQVVQLKSEDTNLKRRGVRYSFQSEDVKEKSRLVMLEHHNVEHALQSKELHKKSMDTCFKNSGFYYPFQSNIVKEKSKNTNKQNTGYEYISQSPIIKDKIRETNRKNCGFGNWSQSPEGRKNHRVNSIKYRELQRANNEPDQPRVGIFERSFLNELQLLFPEYKILRQDPSFKRSIGRTPDGYIKELNLIILFNERFHYLDKKTCLILDDDSKLTIEDFKSVNMNVFTAPQHQWENEKERVIEEYKLVFQNLS